MEIIISANILLGFVKSVNILKLSFDNIVSFINEKIKADRISDKDTIAVIKYISNKLDNILITYFNYYGKLNKYKNVQELISKTADKDDIQLSITEKNEKEQFLGIIYPLDEYIQIIYDLENINTNINILKDKIKSVSEIIINDMETEIKQPKGKIIEFHLVKKYPVQSASSYLNELNDIIQYIEAIINYLNICIETIITYLNEIGILKSAQDILDIVNSDEDYYSNYDDKVKYIFMSFNYNDE